MRLSICKYFNDTLDSGESRCNSKYYFNISTYLSFVLQANSFIFNVCDITKLLGI